jgi:hypothetical protein
MIGLREVACRRRCEALACRGATHASATVQFSMLGERKRQRAFAIKIHCPRDQLFKERTFYEQS